MRAALVLVAVVVLGATSFAAAQPPPGITSSSIAGIRLGMTRAQATARMTRPVRFDRLEDGYRGSSRRGRRSRATSARAPGASLSSRPGAAGCKTADQIGPCSTVAALKRAYGSRLVPFRQGGRIMAYRLGRLIFTVEGGKRVGVVGLGLGTQAVYVALNATECS